SADAVIPLLSAAAIRSEMLEYELTAAHDASQNQGGRPRLLPIRVDYADALPDPLAAILDPLQAAIWNGPGDNERLLAELDRALRRPTAPPPSLPPEDLVVPIGALAPDNPFYIERSTDEDLRQAIRRRDSIILIHGARQMGKTSLLARGLQEARAADAPARV